MTFQEEMIGFAKRIGLPEQETETILNTGMEPEKYASFKRDFYENREHFLRELKKEPDAEKVALTFCTYAAMELHPLYQQKGISDEIYYNTFSDIAIWAANYRKKTGRCGLSEMQWLSYHLNLRLFRLGRLQFQTDALMNSLSVDGTEYPAGTPCLQVHIPEGEPLLPRQCQESYQAAMVFFRGIAPLFLCHSWLLSPALSELLAEDSNILQFARRYTLLELFHNDRSAEERVFGKIEPDSSAYAEDTRLQRSMKRHLMNGGKVPAALGAFCLRNEAGI